MSGVAETSQPTAKRRRRFSLSRQTEAQSHQKGRISAKPNTVNHRACTRHEAAGGEFYSARHGTSTIVKLLQRAA